MKHKACLVLILCCLWLLCYASPSVAIFDSDVDKAKDFIKAGMGR